MSSGTKDFTKVVVRHLPPSMQEADYKAAVDQEFAGRYTWFSFSHGKRSVNATRSSTAYLNFKSTLDVLHFKTQFGGQGFADERGAQHTCAIEYAPFQRVLKGRVKRDPREGSIESDAAYSAFLQELERPLEALPTAEQQLDQRQQQAAEMGEAGSTLVVTPLMQYLQEQKAVLPSKSSKKGAAMGRLPSGGLRSIVKEGPSSPAKANSSQGDKAGKGGGREAAGRRNSASSSCSTSAAASGKAAREAARRALASALGPAPGHASGDTVQASAQTKARKELAKGGPKVRPGFGTWQPTRAAQQGACDATAEPATTEPSQAADVSAALRASAASASRSAAAAAQYPSAKVSGTSAPMESKAGAVRPEIAGAAPLQPRKRGSKQEPPAGASGISKRSSKSQGNSRAAAKSDVPADCADAKASARSEISGAAVQTAAGSRAMQKTKKRNKGKISSEGS